MHCLLTSVFQPFVQCTLKVLGLGGCDEAVEAMEAAPRDLKNPDFTSSMQKRLPQNTGPLI